MVRTIFHLTLMFLVCGSRTTQQDRKECPNEVFTMSCGALNKAKQISELVWKVRDSGFYNNVAFCDKNLRCAVVKKLPESLKAHGIRVLGISNGTLTVKRSSWKISSHTVKFNCTVQNRKYESITTQVGIDLSLECIRTYVGATVNLTRHLIKMLPWKSGVYEVELFSSTADKKCFAYCKSTVGCIPGPLRLPPAFGSRLKITQSSILLERIQDSDQGVEIVVKAGCNSSCDESGGKAFSEFVRHSFTLRIRLRPRQEPNATSQAATSTPNTTSEDNIVHEGYDSAIKVQTKSGAVVGKIVVLPLGKSVRVYLGIPYAEPPVRKLRFAAPKPARPWSGIRKATEFGSACPQPDFPVPNFTSEVGKEDEDCLYLNVFVPSTVKTVTKMAVMVWIHGGGFEIGSSTEYPGHVLASFNDVIVVSFNYRLGVLGFLNIPGTDVKGNYGMFDQVLALKWVQSNIASFGGDPSRVTIFGENAGGSSVSLHLVSPKSQGLFQRAIAQNGAASSPYFAANKEPNKLDALEKFTMLALANCPSGDDLVRCLSRKSVEEIVALQRNVTLSPPTYGMEIISPVVDEDFLPHPPQKMFKQKRFHPNIDVISGLARHEQSLSAVFGQQNWTKDGVTRETFAANVSTTLEKGGKRSKFVEELVKHEYTVHSDPHNMTKIRSMVVDFENDFMFVSPAIFEAKALAKAGHNVYMYVFEHRPDFSAFPVWTGAVRGAVTGFVFGEPFKQIASVIDFVTPRYSDIEKGLSLHVMKLWTDFAKFGSPTPSGSDSPVTWSPYTKEEQVYLALDFKPKLKRKYRAKQVAFWNNVLPRVIRQANRSAMARKL